MARTVEEIAWKSWKKALYASDSGGWTVAAYRLNARMCDGGRKCRAARGRTDRPSAIAKSKRVSMPRHYGTATLGGLTRACITDAIHPPYHALRHMIDAPNGLSSMPEKRLNDSYILNRFVLLSYFLIP